MNTLHDIDNCVFRAIARNTRPKYLYLGKRENASLKEALKHIVTVQGQAPYTSVSDIYKGLEVVPVNRLNWLKVGE